MDLALFPPWGLAGSGTRAEAALSWRIGSWPAQLMNFDAVMQNFRRYAPQHVLGVPGAPSACASL